MILDSTNWKTPANIIADILADFLNVDFQLGINTFVGFMPDSPENCITIVDSGSGEQDPFNKIDNNNIQILIRNKDYQLGYNLANKIKVVLESSNINQGQPVELISTLESLYDYIEYFYGNSELIPPTNVIVEGEKIIGIWVKSNIAFIGRDESNNSLFSSNYRVMINTNKNINRN
jgi:hypothetical protein